MKDNPEKNYRSFMAYISFVMYWLDHDEIQETDENKKRELRKKREAYKEVSDKLEEIRVGRFFALLGDTNEEKELYKKIISLIDEKYEPREPDNEGKDEIYKLIKEIVDDYQIDKGEEKITEKDEER